MTRTTHALSPEVQAILEEVARDPRSHLLRVPNVRPPLDFGPAVRPGEAFLSAAERNLLVVHRAEVAQLLAEAAQRAVYEHPTAAATLHHSVTMDRQLELADPGEWSERREYELGNAPKSVTELPEFSALEQCVATTGTERPSATQLALASLRLVPRTETRIYLALALQQTGEIRSGLGVLYKVLERRPSILNVSYAWENVGLFEWELGNGRQALRAIRTASLALDERPSPRLHWLLVAFMIGDRESLLAAAEQVGELIPDDHTSVEETIRICHERTSTRPLPLDQSHARLFEELEGGMPPAARKVLRAAL